jgi:hypothetical protein
MNDDFFSFPPEMKKKFTKVSPLFSFSCFFFYSFQEKKKRKQTKVIDRTAAFGLDTKLLEFFCLDIKSISRLKIHCKKVFGNILFSLAPSFLDIFFKMFFVLKK